METFTQTTDVKINDILPLFHTNIVKKDNKISILPSANLTFGDINIYYPINYPAIIDALLPFLELHDILKLLMLSKCIQFAILNIYKDNGFVIKNTIVNAMKHNCSNCVENMAKYGDVINLEAFMVGCEYNSLKSMEKLNDSYTFQFLENEITYNIPGSNTFITYWEYIMDDENVIGFNNFARKCVELSFNHTPDETIKLLEYITKYFRINNIETLILICKLQNEKIIENIVKHIDVFNVDISIVKFILPYLCEYNICDSVEYCISILNSDDNYEYLGEIIKNNVDNYKPEIILLLLKGIINGCDDFGEDNVFIIKLVNQFADKQLLKQTLKDTIIDDNLKMSLVSKAYEFNLSKYLPFLKNTKESNIISINEITKNENNVVYTNHLSSFELLNFIVNTDNVKIKTQLILSIDDEYDILKHDDSMLIIVDFAINNYNETLLKHLMNLNNLNINFKVMLIPIVYENGINVDVSFLDETEEFNILSINEAIKYSDTRVYTSKLSFETILKFIVNSNGNARESLLKQLNIKTNEIEKYNTNIINIKSNVCIVNKNILPKHYKYIDDVYKYEDNEVYYNCKFKMSKKVIHLNYTKLLLEMDDSCYHEIFDMIMILLDTGKHYFLKNGKETIRYLVQQQKFNGINISNVIKLLKYYCDDSKLLDDIITKRYFFRQFDNK